ncbi:MAG: hypothetical protein KGJ77_09015 [Acidobacteriota bacterium]|nr:hypothetical protein [Acidobacteriota bacterium]
MAFTVLAVTAVLATIACSWQSRREATARVALGRPHVGHHRAVVRGEALFATGVDGSTVAFDCLMTAGGPEETSLEPTSLILRRQVPARAGEPLADIVRKWAEGGERVFVEVPVDSQFGPLVARLGCGHQALLADVANKGELRRLVSRRSSSLTWPR